MDVFNIICGIITFISLGITIFFGIKSESLRKSLKKMDWSDVLIITECLLHDLKKDNFVPDIILSPGMRGCFFAEILINRIGHHIPAYVGISIVGDNKTIKESIDGYKKIEVRNDWNIFIPNNVLKVNESKILIMDDFTLSGQFPNKVKSELINNKIPKGNIKTFCAVITNVTKSMGSPPDYFYKEVNDDSFYFPWGKANMG